MADILISGIELPTAEEEARLILITRTGRAIDMLCEEYEAIPDHGRLIDADALKSNIVKKLGISDRKYLLPAENAIWEEINKAPTIIPAVVSDIDVIHKEEMND